MIPPALTACAPNVAAITIEAVIHVESGGDPLAINVNHGTLPHIPTNAADAIQESKELIARGYSIDLGLMQVNSRNLAMLGYNVGQMFDPCTNIRAGAAILTAGYAMAVRSYGEGQVALRTALSIYNTGDPVNGFLNGYVAKYLGKSAMVPVLIGTAAVHITKPLNPYTVGTTVLVTGVGDAKTAPRLSMNPYTATTTIPFPVSPEPVKEHHER